MFSILLFNRYTDKSTLQEERQWLMSEDPREGNIIKNKHEKIQLTSRIGQCFEPLRESFLYCVLYKLLACSTIYLGTERWKNNSLSNSFSPWPESSKLNWFFLLSTPWMEAKLAIHCRWLSVNTCNNGPNQFSNRYISHY